MNRIGKGLGLPAGRTAMLLVLISTKPGEEMAVHTLIYSFNEDFTTEHRKQFFAEMTSICLNSGHATQVTHADHVPLPADQYAPVFAASAVAHISCPDLRALEALSGSAELNDFIARWQQWSPYQVVWSNHVPESTANEEITT